MTELANPTTIEFDVSDHLATVTLNRPDKMNSFNHQMAKEVAAAWARVRDDADIRVAVLRANGDRAFCTGLDVLEGRWWMDRRSSIRRTPARLWGRNHIGCGSR